MQQSFWQERWESGVIPFHEGVVNQMLDHWFESLKLEAGAQVFVPLCGKTMDMYWLAQQQCKVLGVEFCEIAARDFFTEQQLAVERHPGERFETFISADIEILRGDFFNLNQTDLAGVSAVYDRASLVALPESDRNRYAQHLRTHLPAGVAMLLISFEYDTARMSGPPFSVSEQEVTDLYASHFEILRLESREIIDSKIVFKERGLESIIEHAFLCTSFNDDLNV